MYVPTCTHAERTRVVSVVKIYLLGQSLWTSAPASSCMLVSQSTSELDDAFADYLVLRQMAITCRCANCSSLELGIRTRQNTKRHHRGTADERGNGGCRQCLQRERVRMKVEQKVHC